MLQGSCQPPAPCALGWAALQWSWSIHWGGLVVSECQLLQSFWGSSQLLWLAVLLLVPTCPARLSCAGGAAHALQCLRGWGGCRELGDIKKSFASKSSASKKSFGSWMNAKVHGPWSSLGWGCSCFSLSDLPSPALSLSYCNSEGNMKMPQPCPALSRLLNCVSSRS